MPRLAPYATAAQLAETTPGLSPARADLALAAASDYVDAVCFGVTDPATGLAPDPGWFPDPVPSRVVSATLVAAARFSRDPEAPWGTVGGIGEVPIYAKGQIPDADKFLLGLRRSFGLA
jgi:hypothetical protein